MKSIPANVRQFLLASFVFPFVILAAPAIGQPVADAAFEAALSHFNRARQGETEQLDAAIAVFRAGPAKPELQPLYSAYLGSAHALQAKAAWLPWKKMKLTDQGLDSIDQALAALRPEHDRVLVRGTPLSLETRMVAAATFVAVPDGLFHRRAAGKALLTEMSRSPLLTASPAGFRAEFAAIQASLQEAEK